LNDGSNVLGCESNVGAHNLNVSGSMSNISQSQAALGGWVYAVHGLFFRVKMVGWALARKFYDRPTALNILVGPSHFLTLRPVGRSYNFGWTKSIIDSSIFHTKERAVNRVGGL